MRETLFRGKSRRSGNWVEGSLLIFPKTKRAKILVYEEADLDFNNVEVDPATVGQYTGLTDKNGKRIFEGDIVRHHNDNPYAIPTIVEMGVVYWDEQFYGWRRTSNGAFHRGVVGTYRMAHDCVYEIIGNRHDNPELLKGGER